MKKLRYIWALLTDDASRLTWLMAAATLPLFLLIQYEWMRHLLRGEYDYIRVLSTPYRHSYALSPHGRLLHYERDGGDTLLRYYFPAGHTLEARAEKLFTIAYYAGGVKKII